MKISFFRVVNMDFNESWNEPNQWQKSQNDDEKQSRRKTSIDVAQFNNVYNALARIWACNAPAHFIRA